MKPRWLKTEVASGNNYTKISNILKTEKLHTVCLEANCPNKGECFNSGTATFLIMGKTCTRNCNYCAVNQGYPEPLNTLEPKKIAISIQKLKLNYAVITSVTRDDLPDGGASHFAETVKQIKEHCPAAKIEVLIPDFKNSMPESLIKIIQAKPDIINHNIEVTKSIYSILRPKGSYEASLSLIMLVSKSNIISKSGLMIGLGECFDDIMETFDHLLINNCMILTIGQYLQPNKKLYPVKKYYHPDEFSKLKEIALKMGFKKVSSGPLVRSSYHAKELAN